LEQSEVKREPVLRRALFSWRTVVSDASTTIVKESERKFFEDFTSKRYKEPSTK
jgi:hypothetical protein